MKKWILLPGQVQKVNLVKYSDESPAVPSPSASLFNWSWWKFAEPCPNGQLVKWSEECVGCQNQKASLLLEIVNVLLADNPEGQPTCLTEEIDCEVMGCAKSKCQSDWIKWRSLYCSNEVMKLLAEPSQEPAPWMMWGSYWLGQVKSPVCC